MNFPAQARTQAVPGRCALIVDADPQVTSALGSVFEPEQWAILHAPDNREALKLAEARSFDLIITGAKSTGKEDIDLLRKIRRVRPHVRLIILTDASTPTDVIAAMRERAFSYFSKPFSTASLAEIVRCATTEPFWDDGIELVSATPEWISIIARCDRTRPTGWSSSSRKCRTCLPPREMTWQPVFVRCCSMPSSMVGISIQTNTLKSRMYARASRSCAGLRILARASL